MNTSLVTLLCMRKSYKVSGLVEQKPWAACWCDPLPDTRICWKQLSCWILFPLLQGKLRDEVYTRAEALCWVMWFLTGSGTHLDMLLQLFSEFVVLVGEPLLQLFEVCESWLVPCFLWGSSASGSLSSGLGFCGCDPHREWFGSLLIPNCYGQCKLLVAWFVTAGHYLVFSILEGI